MAPAKALPPSKAKTPAEKWKAWLASEYNDEQKFKANLVSILSYSHLPTYLILTMLNADQHILADVEGSATLLLPLCRHS